jgi:hypothetical protein
MQFTATPSPARLQPVASAANRLLVAHLKALRNAQAMRAEPAAAGALPVREVGKSVTGSRLARQCCAWQSVRGCCRQRRQLWHGLRRSFCPKLRAAVFRVRHKSKCARWARVRLRSRKAELPSKSDASSQQVTASSQSVPLCSGSKPIAT